MKTDDKLMIVIGVLIMFLGLTTRETAETWLKLLYMINLGVLLRTVYRAGKASGLHEIETLRDVMRGDQEELQRLQREVYAMKEEVDARH